MQPSFWEHFDRFLLHFYEPELLAIDAAAGELTGQRTNRSSDAAALRAFDERAAILVDGMTGSRQIIVATRGLRHARALFGYSAAAPGTVCNSFL